LKKETLLGLSTKKGGDFSKWYSELVVSSELISYYDVSGEQLVVQWVGGRGEGWCGTKRCKWCMCVCFLGGGDPSELISYYDISGETTRAVGGGERTSVGVDFHEKFFWGGREGHA
jgi:hypothetical protein